jgi:Flp pilus assembly protein TadG
MKLSEQKGQSIIEFCVVLPIMLVLLVGMVEFGIVLYDQEVITNCSRECARTGILLPPNPPRTMAQITTDINVVKAQYSTKLITFGGTGTITATPTISAGLTNPSPLQVRVSYPYKFMVLPNFLTGQSGTITLNSTTVMIFE